MTTQRMMTNQGVYLAGLYWVAEDENSTNIKLKIERKSGAKHAGESKEHRMIGSCMNEVRIV